MQLLRRSGWPGNIEQLRQVLTTVAYHRRSGTIHPADLPPECWTVSRRLLSPLESMERDAIMQSLLYHQGNKLQAAGSLGMSRATIYRKIHEYGILTPAPAPHYALRVTSEAASGSRLLTDALHPVHTLCIRTAHGCPVLEQQTGRLGAHSASVITLCPRFALGRPAILRSTGRPVAGGQRAAGGPHVRPAGTATPGGPATWEPRYGAHANHPVPRR